MCTYIIYKFKKKNPKNSGDCIISKRLRIETKREKATEKIQIEGRGRMRHRERGGI